MRRRYGGDVTFYLPEEEITILSTVLRQSLPQFPLTYYSDAVWCYRDEPIFQSPGNLNAFKHILYHLDEFQASGASSRLLHTLEDKWNDDCRRRRYLHQGHSIKFFHILGNIFEQYGCSYDIFENLNLFFTRHVDEIVQQQHGIPVYEFYYSALEKTGYNMEHTRAVLTRALRENYRELAPSDLHRLCYRNSGRPCQHHDCLDEPSHHGGNGVVGEGWGPLPLRRRVTHDGNGNHRRGIVNGEELDIGELCRAWNRDPRGITVDEQCLLGACEGCTNDAESEFWRLFRQQKRLLPRRGLTLARDERRTPRLRRR